MEIVNARIDSTMLGIEGHGIMTCMIGLDYGGSHQGFGGYGFDQQKEKGNYDAGRVGTVYGCTFILRVLEVVGVKGVLAALKRGRELAQQERGA